MLLYTLYCIGKPNCLSAFVSFAPSAFQSSSFNECLSVTFHHILLAERDCSFAADIVSLDLVAVLGHWTA